MTEPASSRPTTSFGVIFLVLFLDLVGFSILFPLYPGLLDHYLAQDSGLVQGILDWIRQGWPEASRMQTAALFGGLLGSGYAFLQFITAPLWGRLSDRIGRRPVLLCSLTGSLVSYLIWVVSGSFALLLLSRLIAGVMGGAAVTASAAVADVTADAKSRSRGMALVGMAFGLGFILGPVIGSLLASPSLRIDGGSSAAAWGLNPFSTPALAAAILSGINLIWALRSFGETLPPERRGSVETERTANPLRLVTGLTPTLILLNLCTLAYTALFSGMESTLGFLVTDRMAFETKHIGMLFGGMGFIAAAMQGGVFRRLAPRHGAKAMAIAGFILLSIGLSLIALVGHHPNLTLLLTGVAVMSCGTGLVFPALSTLISLAADERHQGRAMGGFRSASSLGRAIGPLVAAMAYFQIGAGAPYWISAAGMLLPLVLLLRVRAER